MTKPALQIVWFKRDLRVSDHRPLTEAAAAGPVLPLYIIEPALWAERDMAGRHWDFIAESLVELRSGLAALGQPLVIRIGEVTDILDQIAPDHPIGALWSHEESGNAWTFARDRRVAAWTRARSIPWHEPRQSGVIRRIGSRDGWARRWDAFMAEPASAPPPLAPLRAIDPGPVPRARDLGLRADPCPDRQEGGSRAGGALLHSFLTERGETYRTAMSSPITAAGACSRLSPHLAWGTISSRTAAQALWRRQTEVKAGTQKGKWPGALSSFSGRLHWRDHFMQKLEDEPKIEHRNLHPAYDGLRPTEPDAARLTAWEAGETGLPFVDACMRSLYATGWLNFRMRAMLMAVASYHLWLDWRRPGEHLARRFTDYEPGIHWPQVQMQSGTTGVNTVRIYNPVKQGQDQDPDGVFVRRWVPELAMVPTAHIHTPWTWEGAAALLGRSYPHPIVDHIDAAKAARQKVWAIRKGPAYRNQASHIQAKHGSRKSGIKNRGQRGAQPSGQLSLDLGVE
ncbi:MAG: deoxyribodipyrimidine photo-lyase [Pseudomonadota bacterium]